LKSKEPARKHSKKKSRKNQEKKIRGMRFANLTETRTTQPSNFGDEEGKCDLANAKIRALPPQTTTTTMTATIQKHANKRREHKSHYAHARTGAQIPPQNKQASAESDLPLRIYYSFRTYVLHILSSLEKSNKTYPASQPDFLLFTSFFRGIL
jgi:hypothetical protein